MPDGRLLVPQAGSLKAITAKGEETTLFSDGKHLADQVAVCGEGKYIVFRQIGRPGDLASANLVAHGSERSQRQAIEQRPE